MLGGVILAAALAATLLQQQTTNLILAAAIVFGGVFAWRQKRGDFYKAVAEEKTAETERLQAENDKLKKLTDITPITASLDNVSKALERHARMTEDVVKKVAEMNGSLRAHSVAMEALADRLVLDEAARGLLATAADKHRTPTRRRAT